MDDDPALAKAHVASWQWAYAGIVPESHLQGFTVERAIERFRQSLASDAEETYVAERDGQVIGFLTLGDCRDPDADKEITGEIWGISLSPEYWRKGIKYRKPLRYDDWSRFRPKAHDRNRGCVSDVHRRNEMRMRSDKLSEIGLGDAAYPSVQALYRQ